MPDPIDLSTYSGDALMGCVLASWDHSESEAQGYAAESAGLLSDISDYAGCGPPIPYADHHMEPTPLGARVLAALRALVAHNGWRSRIHRSLAERTYEAYAKEYGRRQSLDRLLERGGFGDGELDVLVPGWRDDPVNLAALALHGREPGTTPANARQRE